jgi:hypothetical protein
VFAAGFGLAKVTGGVAQFLVVRRYDAHHKIMKHKITVSGVVCLLLCVCGCSKQVDESRLFGTWQFDAEHSIMSLAANHSFTLKSDDGSSTLGGVWRLEGGRLITSGQVYTNGSMVIRAAKDNDTRVTELADTRMILQNWGGSVSTLTRVEVGH